MNVESLMSRDPDCCSPQDSVRSAAARMRDAGVGMLPVIENDHPIGVITDRDVCLAVANGVEASAPVGGIASRPAICCSRSAKPNEVLDILRDRRVRRLVVVDELDAVCGVLALDDLAAEAKDHVYEHVPSHADVVDALRAISRYRGLQVAGSHA